MLGGVVVIAAGIGTTVMLAGGSKTNRPDLILHTVKYENLDLTVVERGALESSENKDVTCMVKASKGGNFATTIKWVIDDGSQINEGQHIATLDSAALEDQERSQIIALSQAQSAKIKAETDFESAVKENEEALLKATNSLHGAELDLEKYIGLPRGTLTHLQPAAHQIYLDELDKSLEQFLTGHKKDYSTFDGEFKQLLDDVNGRIEDAEGKFEQWRDRAAYSQRMVIKGYVTQSQVQADESGLSGSKEVLKKLQTEKGLLQTFVAQRAVQNYCSLLREAEIAFGRTEIQTEGKKKQLEAELNSKKKIFQQEQMKLKEIKEQIEICNIHAPQDGMVVYFTPEQSRFGGGSQQSIIAQGEPVREGQKLMRIPNLKKMQVVARVHEAMISRIKGDYYKATGFSESIRAAALINRNILPQLVLLKNSAFENVKQQYYEQDRVLASKGQAARVRVDAFSDRPLQGHVHTVATVASQDFFTSDVKVYQTVVVIDDPIDGLRPGMSAEVTIKIENTEQVLAIPVEAIVGGAEQGDKRKCFVMTEDGPKEREITVGLSNDKMAEVRGGLQEGDQVVHNPKAILGDKAKTRDAASEKEGKGKDGKKKGTGPKQ